MAEEERAYDFLSDKRLEMLWKHANVSGYLLNILLGMVQCEWVSGCISCDIFTNADFVYFSNGTSIAVSTSWSSLDASAAPPGL